VRLVVIKLRQVRHGRCDWPGGVVPPTPGPDGAANR